MAKIRPRRVTAVGEASYDSVYLLALAMEACGDDLTTENILANFDNLEFDAPQGTITVDRIPIISTARPGSARCRRTAASRWYGKATM